MPIENLDPGRKHFNRRHVSDYLLRGHNSIKFGTWWNLPPVLKIEAYCTCYVTEATVAAAHDWLIFNMVYNFVQTMGLY